MKKILSKYIFIILIMFLFLGVKIFKSYNSTSYLFSSYHGFEINGSTIVKANIEGGNVVIPSVIDGITITTIGDNAFKGLNIDNVIIPDTITTIGDYAFANNNIKNLKVPDGVLEIGEGAFIHNKIEWLEIASDIIIGNACFNDNRLKGDDAFFYKDNELISYGGSVKGNVEIPNGSLVSIGEKAFFDVGIVSISIPDSVTTIKKDAFKNNYLVEIYLSSNVTTIDIEAFSNNIYLSEIVINNSSNNLLNYPWGAENSDIYWLK